MVWSPPLQLDFLEIAKNTVIGKVKAIKLKRGLDAINRGCKCVKQKKYDYQMRISLRWLNQKLESNALIPIENHLEGVNRS